ncbi:cytochrome-c oxidase, cbb3-type subunit III [Sideroxydans lithotrophicus]|uniref:Cbb3-type cytochrome c oxidase subunit n=1 Tax=Sideroxydans lithotrophicus (strain ES-1) TaxID=580332 RepID=D5CM41_SIDLE|nr:cytochrome-c oxidase, cbb3-type subunit III [Sideroxydans lithotrophicus]ADE10655.1 cytochrome c oxidase, cbb3-type, subunit III [Sideroxydans lithotrophicus ES-1]
MSDKHDAGGVPTTGHVWDDDLGDFTNQPPKWWMLGLAASAIWCVVYFLYYPSIPVSNAHGYFKGLGHWTAITEMEADKSVVDEVRGKYEAKLKDMTPAAILADSELTEYVTRSGKVLFGDNCAACHGTNGVGTVDKQGLFAPILRDDDWLYGGKIDDIYTSIVGGRQGLMTPHKGVLSDQQIDDVAHYVKAMSDEGKSAADTDSAVAAGKKVFTESDCTACHGADGKGMQAMGSANLTDKVWRFDGSLEGIKQTIANGVNAGPDARIAVMPSFQAAGKLSDAELKKLAVYVYKFGGGQADAPATK